MSDEPDEVESEQTVSRMPSDEDRGPHFPSGMSAPEAALAGATAGMTDEEVARLKGEEAAVVEE